jgi:branched-chain amino acid transport system ATP-binding protein
VLKVENISAFYGDVQALRDVSLDVPEKKIVALLGPNAAGKSTTLRAISNVITIRSGRITFHEERIDHLPLYRIVEMGIIHVPEGRGLFSTLTVRENLEMGAYSRRARKHLRESLAQALDTFPVMKDRQGQLAGSLSGGEQQMCSIARGLMARPRLLMIDEMSLGLAPLIVQQMFEIVHKIAESGITVLLVEQQIQRALQVAHTAYILESGSTVLSGATADLSRHEHVKRVYLGM